MAKKVVTKEVVKWEIKIVHYGVKAADQFIANPDNPRLHPYKQREAIATSIDTLGVIAPVIVNQRTGYLIDGHERVMQALSIGDDTLVPYVEVNLTDEQEKQALAVFDLTTYLGEYDKQALGNLLEQIKTDDNEKFQSLLDELAKQESITIELNDADDGWQLESQTESEDGLGTDSFENGLFLPDDILFQSDNDMGVPLLIQSQQARALIAPVMAWGQAARSKAFSGTYHFYIDDYKFEALWRNPMPIVLSGCKSLVEPNFSTHTQMPRAVALWKIYQKRWLARFWQENGISVFVDMNVEDRFFDLNLLGVPKDWRAFANRAYESQDLDHLKIAFDKLCERKGDSDILYLVIGGRSKTEKLCLENKWQWIPEMSSVIPRARGENYGQK